MNTFRIVMIASVAALAAACASTPSVPVTPTAPAVANIAGNWVLAVNTPMGPIESKMSVIQNGKDINGRIESDRGNADYTGTVTASDVKFSYHVDAQGTDMRFDYTGVVEAGTMKGKAVFASFGEGTFTAKRQ